ncbi:MAG: FAD-dependent oxidoreductase [Pseudonocardiaceae bacterium]|nr:FAD-dependent oxidoreductase [Pseudonocardiaceae bacterium]
MHVIVVGAGIIGSAVAASLAEHGARVTLLDAAAMPGTGTSSGTFGWVNANDRRPDSYHELSNAAVREHHGLATGGADWFQGHGHLECAVDAEHRQRLLDTVLRLRDLGYPAEPLSYQQARALEPDVDFPEDGDFALFPEEGHCYPELLIAHLLGRARVHGARFRGNSAVLAIMDGAVQLDTGEVLTADHVVSCVGRHTATLLPEVPMIPPARGNAAVGFLARTPPVPVRLSRVLTMDTLRLRPAGGGRLWLQALDLDIGADPAVPPDDGIRHTFSARAAETLSSGYRLGLDALLVGQRALPVDGLPVVGPLPERPRVYVITTHSGVTLAPLLGRLAAEELYSGARAELLTPFRPERFANGAAVAQVQPAARPTDP